MTNTWKTYVCRYYHEGKWWDLDIVARDAEDAEARAKKLGNLQLLGELKAQIPATIPGSGFLAKLVAAFGNLFRAA